MRALLPIPITMAAILLGACGSGEEARPAAAAKTDAGNRVEIKAFQFKPDPIEVKVGDEVTFVNLDATVHDVTAKELGVAEKLDGKNSEATVKFDQAGTFEYLCTLHDGPGMRGQVVVR